MGDSLPPAQPVTDLSKLVLESYQAEYRELADNWRTLDTKAQGVTGISGLFLAAAFAFVRDGAGQLWCLEKVALVLAIVALVGAVAVAVFALRVRVVSLPPIGEQFAELVNDVLKADGAELAERLPALVNDQSEEWRKTNIEIASHNSQKAGLLRWAVSLLLAAAVLVGALAIAAIIFDR